MNLLPKASNCAVVSSSLKAGRKCTNKAVIPQQVSSSFDSLNAPAFEFQLMRYASPSLWRKNLMRRATNQCTLTMLGARISCQRLLSSRGLLQTAHNHRPAAYKPSHWSLLGSCSSGMLSAPGSPSAGLERWSQPPAPAHSSLNAIDLECDPAGHFTIELQSTIPGL